MAQRDLTTFREVNQVVAEHPDQLLSAVGKVGGEIMRQGQEARINENLSKAQLELGQLENKYQIEFESDPMKGMDGYRQERQAIFDRYGEDISPLYRRFWNDSTRKVNNQNEATQQTWALRQTQVNTKRAIAESMKNNFLQANLDGQKFGKSEDTEVGAYMNFASSKSHLAGWGNKNLGEETTGALLSDYDKDYVKSFISGVANSNPKKAAEILASDDMKARFTSDELDTMENVVRKSAKRAEIGSLFQEMEGEDQVTDIVMGEEGDYFTKRLTVDTMEYEGKISSSTAEKARRVLTSQKNLDAVTDTETMSDLVTQMYDLNSIADTSSEDYLMGVQNIRNDILEMQSKGKISTPDAQKLNGQLRTLTAQKTAQATENVGLSFYDSNQKFTSLPPQYRGEATRQLFYKSYGQDLSPEQYDAEANKIIDSINSGLRKKTVEKLNKINMPDTEFLKTKGYTIDDVRETAEKYGISEQEVIKRMKAK